MKCNHCEKERAPSMILSDGVCVICRNDIEEYNHEAHMARVDAAAELERFNDEHPAKERG